MAIKEIKEGTVVYLKSGSPAMTAGREYTTGYRCVWFLNGEYKEAYFYADQLTETNPNKSSTIHGENPPSKHSY